MENVIMMVNNAGDVFKRCISTKKTQVDIRVTFHTNDILNDSF